MNYSKQYISEIGNKTGFINSNIEKVLRLMDVLCFVYSKVDPEHTKLVLKGGTAINLLYMNLPRLSVDIDLDYIGALDKEEAVKDREIIMNSLDNFMSKEGYAILRKSRESTILASRSYSFTNAFGNKDNIKIEINFIDRIHIFDIDMVEASYFGKHAIVSTPIKEELFGMKICALIDRAKPRDLYDVNNIIAISPKLEKKKLRKSTLFYLSLDGVFVVDDNTFKKAEAITLNEIKRELLPVLAKGDKFDLKETKAKVLACLKELLVMNDAEKQYMNRFSIGDYNPYLLFTDSVNEEILYHPMAKWRVSHIKKLINRLRKKLESQ